MDTVPRPGSSGRGTAHFNLRRLREEVPADSARQAMSAYAPAPILDTIFSLWENSVGVPALVTSGVEKVTGRSARTFAQWAADHAADF